MTNWQGYYLTGANRVNISETTLNDTAGSPNNVTNLVLKWKFNTSGMVRNSVVVSNSFVLIGSDFGRVYSLATTDGAQRWVANLSSGTAIRSTCYADGTRVYVGCNDGKLYALTETTGAVSWTYDTGDGSAGAVQASPVVIAGIPARVYFGSNNGKVYAVPTTGGAATWIFDTGSGTAGAIVGAIAAYAGVVYATSANGSCYALNATTGAVIRTYKCRTGATINTPPCLAGDTHGLSHLIFGASDNYLYDYNVTTGALIWEDLQSGQWFAGSAVDPLANFAFCGTHNWSGQCHDITTDKLNWLKDGGGGSGSGINSAAFRAAPCVLPNAPADAGNGLVLFAYMGEDNCLRIFDEVHASGGQASVWKYPATIGGFWDGLSATTDNYAAPTVVDARVYMGNDGGYVYCFGI